MLLINERLKPNKAPLPLSPHTTVTVDPSTLPVTPLGSVHDNFPFGPSTFTAPSAAIFTLTFAGSSMGFFPIRDIGLPNEREQFSAHVLFFGLAAAEDAFRRR